MSKWIRKGDKVGVIAGNDKGKTGEVLLKKDNKVVVQGVNIRKKHQKARSQDEPSSIVSIERPIHISNIRFCSPDDKFVKLKARQNENGKKEIYYNLDKENEVVHRVIKDK